MLAVPCHPTPLPDRGKLSFPSRNLLLMPLNGRSRTPYHRQLRPLTNTVRSRPPPSDAHRVSSPIRFPSHLSSHLSLFLGQALASVLLPIVLMVHLISRGIYLPLIRS